MLDAVYWRLHASYLRNEREDAKAYLEMLESEAGLEARLSSEIGPKHMERFRRIREGIRRGDFRRLHGNGGGSLAHSSCGEAVEKSCREKEFCRALASAENRPSLLGAVGAGSGAVWAMEVPMWPYGRCDVVLGEGRSSYVVEVKMGEAPASVVSQIDRYRLSMELDMCMGLYDEVFAFVLAEGFPPYVASELPRMSVSMILHSGSPGTLRRIS